MSSVCSCEGAALFMGLMFFLNYVPSPDEREAVQKKTFTKWAGCVSTVWKMWTRPCSFSKNRGFTWRTWGPMTLSTATTVSSSASFGPSSCVSR
uniref:Uncharacterized protein n=1 Tax=Fundulus heteroclitus TaxID=8078 RepID=A0A3Q2SNM3_FUNHE